MSFSKHCIGHKQDCAYQFNDGSGRAVQLTAIRFHITNALCGTNLHLYSGSMSALACYRQLRISSDLLVKPAYYGQYNPFRHSSS